MGCGVSKFDINAEEKGGSAWHTLSLPSMNRRNDRAVVVDSSLLSKPLDEGGDGNHEHAIAKGDHDVLGSESLDKEKIDHEGHDRDDSIEYPRSLSFRIYCIPSSDDENKSEADVNAGKVKEKQEVEVGKIKENEEMEVENNKKGRCARYRRRGAIGKGIKTGSAKVKSILRV